mmetsp:Transcript_604/g.684  ORF Transcript_604/g.684 Transcript_604/m.684 type:complete len:157 (-) Transcript_604:446-916(-)
MIDFIISLSYKCLTYGGFLLFLFLVTLYFYQDKMLYVTNMPSPEMKFPESNPPKFKSPVEYSLNYEEIVITTPDGLKLCGWFIKHHETPELKETIVFFHANAGNIGFRLPNIAELITKSEVNVVVVGYRGYGHSEGVPTEKGIKIDALAVFDWVLE